MMSRTDLEFIKAHQRNIQAFVYIENMLNESMSQTRLQPARRPNIMERIATSIYRHTCMMFRKTVHVGK